MYFWDHFDKFKQKFWANSYDTSGQVATLLYDVTANRSLNRNISILKI